MGSFCKIEAKAVYLDSEREKEASLLEEMRGNQEFTDFYDLVNSPVQSSSKEPYIDVVQTSASKTIYSTLNPVKSMTLNVLVGDLLRKTLCVRLIILE